MNELRARVALLDWPASAIAEIQNFNGEHVLHLNGCPNHRSACGPALDALLGWMARAAPGSYGLLYWRDDEGDTPAGSNNFQVTVLAQGTLTVRLDPFLSPRVPTLEDGWEPDGD